MFLLDYTGASIDGASWDDVRTGLNKIENEEATFRLMIYPEPESGPVSLGIQAEDGYYLMTLLLAVGGTREYDAPPETDDMVSILGYEYDPAMVTKDYELVCRVVKEFFETGDVSKDILK